jgi:hypothetical protein
MKELTVKVKENKVKFFKELIRNLDFVELKKKRERSKSKILSNIKSGLEEVASIEKGKNKSTPLKDFLNDL